MSGRDAEVTLRARVRDFLKVPFLTPAGAAVAARAAVAALPVRIAAAPGCGAYRVARALHRGGDPAGFVSVRIALDGGAEVERRARAALESDGAAASITLYVDAIESQPPGVQETLLRLCDEGVRWQGRSASVRLIVRSEANAAPHALLPELRRRLSALVIPLPPLAERLGDLPALAGVLAAAAAAAVGRPAPTLTEAAIERLATEADTIEDVEAILERSIVLRDAEVLDAADLGPEPAPARGAAAGRAPERAAAPGRGPRQPLAEPRYRLDALITELAHELKNPMVTIKTFAQNIDHLLSDAELREKFTRLTGEAVDRMDAFLEELLQFSRFAAPSPRAAALADLASRSIATLDSRVRDQVRLNGLSPSAKVRADEEQILFAFRAILRGLARELPADTGIVLDSPGPGMVVFQGKAPGTTRKLQRLLTDDSAADSETSLHFTLAETLIRRNGGSCRIVRGPTSLEARLSLPVADNG